MPDLISDAYRQEQARLHRDNPGYGVAAVGMAPLVAQAVRRMRPETILDYGAGKQRLATALSRLISPVPPILAYDPAIPELAEPPEPADLVVCLDVLEHIEPSCLDAVIQDLARVTRYCLLASIATGPARKVLSDGRNAHLIQQPSEWWLPRIWSQFHIRTLNDLSDYRFWLVAVPRKDGVPPPATP